MNSSKLVPPARVAVNAINVWVDMERLVEKYQPVDLSVGTPDFLPSTFVINALTDTVNSKNILLHQYSRSYGHIRLVTILSKLFSRLLDRVIDPMLEIVITIGADEALFCAVFGYVNPGDEVILLEPCYNLYEALVRTAGGIPVFVPLRPIQRGDSMSGDDYIIDVETFSSKFNSKTKAIIVNTPQNPIGKVYSESELKMIAEHAMKWDVLVIMDEVYQWMVFEERQHIRMATIPNMWDRTVTIGSAGKAFGVTGWKIGWAYGPKHLIINLQKVHETCLSSCPTPLQEAVAICLEIENGRLGKAESFFKQTCDELKSKRDRMMNCIAKTGMIPILPQGGCFMVINYSDFVNHRQSTSKEFSDWLIREKNLAMLPLTAFYGDEHKSQSDGYVRLCFNKRTDTLEAVEDIFGTFECSSAQALSSSSSI